MRPKIPTSRCATTCGCSASCWRDAAAARRASALRAGRAGPRAGEDATTAAGHDDDFEALADELRAMPLDEAVPVARSVRAFPQPRQHRRAASPHPPPARLSARSAARPQQASSKRRFARLLASRASADRLHEAVCALQIELVLTAHPTEITRRTLAEIQPDRASAGAPRSSRPDAARARGSARGAPPRDQGGVGDRRSAARAASPLDEVRAGSSSSSRPLGGVAAVSARRSTARCAQHRPRPADRRGARAVRLVDRRRSRRQPDRDARRDTARCLMARWMARSLSRARSRRSATSCRCTRRRRSCGSAREARTSRTARCCAACAAAARATGATHRGGLDADARRRTQRIVERRGARRAAAPVPSLARRDRAQLIADGRLLDVLRRVAAFGLTLVRLDIRQDASGTPALAAITRRWPRAAMPTGTKKRVDFLLRELAGRRPLIPAGPRPARGPRRARHVPMIARTPARSLGAYVITMARAVGRARGRAAAEEPALPAAARRAAVRDVARPASAAGDVMIGCSSMPGIARGATRDGRR